MRRLLLFAIIVVTLFVGCSKDTTSTGRLDAPTGLVAEKYGLFHIRIRWNDNSTGEESFFIDRKKGESDWDVDFAEVAKNTEEYVNNINTSAATDTLYSYRVRAFDSGDYSDYSISAAYIDASVAPDSLTFVQMGQDSVGVSWNDNTIGEEGFALERRSEGENWTSVALLDANVTSFVDAVPALYDTLLYRVSAFVGDSHSEYLENNYNPILPVPNNLTITCSSITSVQLSWDDNATLEDGYRIYKSEDLISWDEFTLPQNSTQWVDSSVTPGVMTYYKVLSFLGQNTSPAVSDSVNTIPKPSNLVATANNDNLEISLTWDDFSLFEDTFRIERRTLTGDFAPLATIPANSTHYIDTQIENLVTYYYRITTNAQGYSSPPSAVVSATCTAGQTTMLLVPSQFASIQDAIDAARDGDRVLVLPGHYREKIDFEGKSISVVSMYSLTHDHSAIVETIIDGESDGSVVRFANAEDSLTVIQGFTVQNGFDSSGIFCSSSRPMIKNMIIKNSHATSNGGGLRVRNLSHLVVDSVEFVGNCAVNGGGMSVEGESVVLIKNCTFTQNTAEQGGGLEIIKSFATLENNEFFANEAEHGGGMHSKTEAEITMIHCRFFENLNDGFDGRGGALYTSGSTYHIENTIFADNASYGPNALGGAIYTVSNSNIDLLNVVITDNIANIGGAVYITELSDITIRNCIIWENLPYDIDINGRAVFMHYTDITEDFPGNNNINEEPNFTDPENHDYHLQQDSPCIDAGDPDGLYNDPDGSVNDMGAYGGPNGQW